MRPRKVVLLQAVDGYLAGERAARLLSLPVDVWGYRAALRWDEVAEGVAVDAAVLLAPSVPHAVAMAGALLDRWSMVRLVVVGPFVPEELEALGAVGLGRVLPAEVSPVVLRDTLRLVLARKRGPKPARVAVPLAPLAVQMERAA